MNAKDLYGAGRSEMAAGKLETAIRHFQKSAELVPHFKTLELLGECFMRLGAYKKAVPPLAAASALNRGVRASALLADAFFRMGNNIEAEYFVHESLRRDPNNRLAKDIQTKLRRPT